jgi:5'-nucleotidase / UDP-sugar diphosphatase
MKHTDPGTPSIRDNARFSIRIIFLGLMCVALCATSALSQEKRFTLLHTSDEHSALLPAPLVDYKVQQPNPALGGYARLSALVNQIREEKGDEPVMLFSSGDYIGGTPFAWLALEDYSAENELMQRIGYDGAAIGNHEFDYGPDVLTDYYLRAGYPERNAALTLLSANLSIPDGHGLHAVGIQPHRLYRLSNGLTLGVFGLLGKRAYSVAPSAKPVTISDPLEVAAAQVKALQAAGADVIIALTHSGIDEDRELADNVAGIDIILGGHDHIVTHVPEVSAGGGTLILHSGSSLRYLGKLELAWNGETGRVTLVNEEGRTPYLLLLDSSIQEDPDMLAHLDTYTRRLNAFVAEHTEGMFEDVAAHVMRSGFSLSVAPPMSESTVGNFVTDAMRLATEELLGEPVHVAFQANGVIRADIVPGRTPESEGMVSFFDMVSVSGLGMGPDGTAGYPLVSFYLTAREIHNVLEIASLLSQLKGNQYFIQVSGLRYQYDTGKAMWLQIPFLKTPVPAYRSVREVVLYAGAGKQDDGGRFVALDRSSGQLYHVVSDHYLTSFLPMVGEILPRLKLVLKDKAGNPLTPDETIIRHSDREFKVWEALARYATSLKPDDQEIAVMPTFYRATQGRIVAVTGIPLRVWSYLALFAIVLVLIAGIYWAVKRVRMRFR